MLSALALAALLGALPASGHNASAQHCVVPRLPDETPTVPRVDQ